MNGFSLSFISLVPLVITQQASLGLTQQVFPPSLIQVILSVLSAGMGAPGAALLDTQVQICLHN